MHNGQMLVLSVLLIEKHLTCNLKKYRLNFKLFFKGLYPVDFNEIKEELQTGPKTYPMTCLCAEDDCSLAVAKTTEPISKQPDI